MKHPLTKYLDSRGESQSAFAKRCGVHVSIINRLLNGKRKPSHAVAKQVARATGQKVKWTDLFEWKGAA